VNFSSLSSSDKMAVIAAAVVVLTGLFSFANEWGGLMLIPVIGGLLVLGVLFMPQSVARLGSRGTLILAAGAVSAVVWIIVALDWIGWIGEHLATLDTLQFLVGLVASLWLAWTGWQAFQAEGGKFQIGAPKQ